MTTGKMGWVGGVCAIRVLVLGVALYGVRPAVAATPTLGEVIVTAQKREERSLDVPISLTTISRDVIEQANVSQIKDLVMLTPGLEISETIGRQTTSAIIRGIGPQALFSDPTVLTYVDGFTLGFSRTADNAQLFDLERIEVLKGPQATLYGRNALGGVINYVTRKPGNELEGYVRGELGPHDSHEAAASIGGPLVRDKLFAKIAAGSRESGGFLDNEVDGTADVNGERDRDFRGNLRFTPTERFEINATANYSESDDECGDCSNVPESFTGSVNFASGAVDFNEGNRTVRQDTLGKFERDERTYVLDARYDFDGAALTSISGYGRVSADVISDLNRLPGPSFLGTALRVKNETESYSEEIRLASDGADRASWLLGLYGYKNNHDSDIFFDANQISNSLAEVWNYAGFGNLEFEVTERLSLGAGIRYDYEKRRATDFRSNVVREKDIAEWLPKLTASFRLAEDLNIYATVARGYHSGGFNSLDSPAPEVDPEYVLNYELGLKGRTSDGRIQYDLATYYVDWDDMQVTQTFVGGTGGTYLVNAGRARITGAEASIQAVATDRLTLAGSIAYNDAEYREFIDILNAPAFGADSDLSGNQLPYSPKLSGSASAQYIVPLAASGWQLRLRGDARYTGERSFDPTNLTEQDAFWLGNVYAGVENDTIEIGAFVDNVFDERYATGGSISTFLFPPLFTVGDPRTYGLRVRVNF